MSPGDGASGTFVSTITLTNVSGTACRFYAYPGIGLLSKQRMTLPSKLHRGKAGFATDPGPRLFTVQPGKAGAFAFSWSNHPVGAGRCPRVGFVEVTPPDEKDFLLVPADFTVCQHGSVSATAMVPASAVSAFGARH